MPFYDIHKINKHDMSEAGLFFESANIIHKVAINMGLCLANASVLTL